MFRTILLLGSLFLLCVTADAQQEKPSAGKNPPATAQASAALRASAAYAEVILRKTELQADLESLEIEFTDEYPKVKETRSSLSSINKELDRLIALKPADAPKLTAGLGKLIVRKVELETDLATLKLQYDDKHPDVITAKKKVAVFEKAISDILNP